MNDFLGEILSQHEALTTAFSHIIEKEKNRFLKIKNYLENDRINKLIFTGIGSSLSACYLPFYFLNQHGIVTEMREAGEFALNLVTEKNPKIYNKTCIVIVSQSGESGEIIELLKKLRMTKAYPVTCAITNNPKSTLAKKSDIQIYMNLEQETSVTSKTYICSLLILYVLAKTIISEFFDREREIKRIEYIARQVQFLLEDKEKINFIWEELLTNFGVECEFLEVLSRGPSLSTAHQAALTFKEITKSYSEAQPISEFRHGGIECLNDTSKLIIITSDENSANIDARFILKLIKEWKFDKLLYITNQPLSKELTEMQKNPKIIIYQHEIKDPFLSPLYEIIILQLLFYKMAEKRGLQPGKFIYSQKITRGL